MLYLFILGSYGLLRFFFINFICMCIFTIWVLNHFVTRLKDGLKPSFSFFSLFFSFYASFVCIAGASLATTTTKSYFKNILTG